MPNVGRQTGQSIGTQLQVNKSSLGLMKSKHLHFITGSDSQKSPHFTPEPLPLLSNHSLCSHCLQGDPVAACRLVDTDFTSQHSSPPGMAKDPAACRGISVGVLTFLLSNLTTFLCNLFRFLLVCCCIYINIWDSCLWTPRSRTRAGQPGGKYPWKQSGGCSHLDTSGEGKMARKRCLGGVWILETCFCMIIKVSLPPSIPFNSGQSFC